MKKLNGRAAVFMALVTSTACIAFFPSCKTTAATEQTSAPIVQNVPDLDGTIPGDPYGRKKISKAVYVFSQTGVGSEDSQVYSFPNAVLMRAWQKWDRSGLAYSDYNFDYVAKARAANIDFIAGGTGSVVFADENPSAFRQWATTDAFGEKVRHDYIVPGAHRASIANESYRDYVVSFCKTQIDGGVDGVFIDEANAGYNGSAKWRFNGNEGYDDYFIAAFNAFLIARHPDFSGDDWKRVYKMTDDNIIRADVSPGDLERNFNYREYLQSHGWASYPDTPENPLAPAWGTIECNRMDVSVGSFRERAMTRYWREIVTELREYAREKYGKEILVTSNGLFPFTDFNSFGLYNHNKDYGGREVRWIPERNGRLDGARSLMGEYRALLARSEKLSGDVPLVLFIDWPTEMMNAYYGFSLEEKKDFWRIYAAEAYACGLYYAFHLRTAMPNEPTAAESGILGFLVDYAKYYDSNAQDYVGTEQTAIRCAASVDNVATAVSRGRGKAYLHLVNHEYDGAMEERRDFTVSLDPGMSVRKVTLKSPDFAGDRSLPFENNGSSITIKVDSLLYYDVIVLE